MLLGTAVTAIIQPSGVKTVIIIGLVNAGLLTLHSSIGIIMGADIGTGVTALMHLRKVRRKQDNTAQKTGNR